jgi:hypothetical protein
MPRMSKYESTPMQQLNETVGIAQSQQGEEGCYAELFRVIRSKGNLLTMYNFMLPPGGYEAAMRELTEITRTLPPLQSPEILAHAMERIECLGK